MSQKAIDIVKGYIAKGRDSNWTWEQMSLDILKAHGIDVGDRGKQVGSYCGKALRGMYSTREKAWNATWGDDVSADAQALEMKHVVELAEFEAKFTLEHRPAPPPKPVKEPKAEAEGGEAPPAPPAPPADAPAPPPPPAG